MDTETFDLDGLVRINYDYDSLKKVIAYLLKRDKLTAEKLAKQAADFEAAQAEIKVYVTPIIPSFL
jgi:hypothetical protein